MPAGFMPVVSNGVILVQLCSGQGPQTIALELPGTTGEHDHGEHKKADALCAFAGLSSPTLAAADALLLAIAIAFILATGFRLPPRIVLWRGIYLRPPAIGPPPPDPLNISALIGALSGVPCESGFQHDDFALCCAKRGTYGACFYRR